MASARQSTLSTIKQRAISYSSQISVAFNVSEFLESKILGLESTIEYVDSYKAGLVELYEGNKIEKRAYDEEIKEVDRQVREVEEQGVALKRQKKIIQEDLQEERPKYETMEQAYASVITAKVMAASRQKNSNFNQTAFKESVYAYYDAAIPPEKNPEIQRKVWCPISGWNPEDTMKAAHLVPKSLESTELSHLFGVGEAVLYDPRNGGF